MIYMKKCVSLMLVLIIAVGLCGCGSVAGIELPPLPQVTDTPVVTAPPAVMQEPTEPPVQSAEVAEQQVMVSIKNTTKKEYDPENSIKLILTFAYDTPTVFIDGNQEASNAINEYCARLEDLYYTGENYSEGAGTGFNNFLTLAQDNYTYVVQEGIEGANLEMVSSLKVSVPRIDDQVLTILYNDYSYTGGAHGFYWDRGYCFDTVTGDILTLETIAQDQDKLRAALKDYMVNTVQNDVETAERIDLGLFEDGDYASGLEKLIRDGSWYFSDDGIVIFSDLYEISSYAAGSVSFCIPYEQLTGIIDDRFIPEKNTADGKVTVMSGSDIQTGNTPIIDKVTVTKEGEQVFFRAEGEVRKVCLTQVEYSDAFYETQQLWYCSMMNDHALQVQTDIPDGMPTLKLSYATRDGAHSFYLTQSDKDGSLILLENEAIAAVG